MIEIKNLNKTYHLKSGDVEAAEYGHSERRECGYLLTHGLFHLMGYDHMTEAEKPVMRAMEEKALASIGLTREE